MPSVPTVHTIRVHITFLAPGRPDQYAYVADEHTEDLDQAIREVRSERRCPTLRPTTVRVVWPNGTDGLVHARDVRRLERA